MSFTPPEAMVHSGRKDLRICLRRCARGAPDTNSPCNDEPVLVRLKDIRLERLRDFGDVWIALGLWRLLGLDTLLTEEKFLRSREGRYIVGTPKATLRKFEKQLVEQNWEEVQAGVEVKLVHTTDGDETFILARSDERREKEKAMHERFISRMEEGLKKLQSATENGRLKDETTAHRRLGRLQGRNSRAAKAFDVKIERLPKSSGKARLRLTWTRNEAWKDWAALSEGCYLLRSGLPP